ncbi:regulatory protein, luxR family [Actinomadura meyerae]|uniref:Regulatory protein, luxR family n=1 Tax=Actinomadura meyerae TaxID=240840 RepID=A0A239IH58_9ACTN|nr:LuxR family transcriptional regulator [Actinomadura meyerae]SNS92895.1 regulatory protein, luxR family [Actinomadura meyerae]
MQGETLYGRRAEQEEIGRLLERARAGAGGALIVRGEAGVGKSALLGHAARAAAGTRVLRWTGIEAEAALPFAALHLLLVGCADLAGFADLAGRAGLAGLLERLPAEHAAALRAALGPVPPRPRARLLAGPALLALLTELAAGEPLLCLVDDAHWLDRASADALLFAARRAAGSGLTFVIAVRDGLAGADPHDWSRTGVPELPLAGLDDDAAERLLAERSPDLPAARRAEAVGWAGGNPLALLGFPDAGSALFTPVPGEFARAVRRLPRATRLLLAAAAADDTGSPGAVEAAARILDVPLGALDAAEEAGLVRLTEDAIRFPHPLARAAAYQGVPAARRAEAHRALDEAGRDARTRARADLSRASAELERNGPQAAGRLLLDRAAQCDEPGVRTRLLDEAVLLAWLAGDRAMAREASAGVDKPFPEARLALALLDGDAAAAGRLAAMVRDGSDPRRRLLAAEAALLTGDDAAAAEFAAHCRAGGPSPLLPRALIAEARARLMLGDRDAARALADEAREAAERAGARHLVAAAASVRARQAAMEGDEVRCRALSSAGAAGARVGDALGLLSLGLGRPGDALERFRELHRDTAASPPAAFLSLADHVEAAVAAGRPEAAAAPMERLAAFARETGRPWADGAVARCRALLATDPAAAERHFTHALRVHHGADRPFERARTELLYGEWLRRARRRARARARLRAALEVFERLGAVPWAERARRELRAAGEGTAPPDASGDPSGTLTAQELQVVRMATTGATNRQIAARLGLSHRTVAYHLYKAFPKLGVASRAELHRCLPAADREDQSA